VSFPQGLPPTTVQVMNQLYHANLPSTMAPSDVVGVYPTQLLEVALGFAMFAVLWRYRRHAHAPGWLFGLYCLLAGVERFIVEFFRAKSDMVGPVTSAQVVALGVAAAGLLLVTWRRAPTPVAAPAR
jgi:phosphatidylglycerol:prolipoprotein diacylglycerol transferase